MHAKVFKQHKDRCCRPNKIPKNFGATTQSLLAACSILRTTIHNADLVPPKILCTRLCSPCIVRFGSSIALINSRVWTSVHGIDATCPSSREIMSTSTILAAAHSIQLSNTAWTVGSNRSTSNSTTHTSTNLRSRTTAPQVAALKLAWSATSEKQIGDYGLCYNSGATKRSLALGIQITALQHGSTIAQHRQATASTTRNYQIREWCCKREPSVASHHTALSYLIEAHEKT